MRIEDAAIAAFRTQNGAKFRFRDAAIAANIFRCVFRGFPHVFRVRKLDFQNLVAFLIILEWLGLIFG